MAEASAMNSEGQGSGMEGPVRDEYGIKTEVQVKPEPVECVVCLTRAAGAGVEQLGAGRSARGTPLPALLLRLARCELADAAARFACRACLDLIDVLEQAELEYLKLKETFEAIISRNPLFEVQDKSSPIQVKLEFSEDYIEPPDDRDDGNDRDDSEDEPLALAKKKRQRKPVKRKQKVYSTTKRKTRAKDGNKDSWECSVCGAAGRAGGGVALAAHQLATHTLHCEPPGPASPASPALRDVKKEDSADGSESSHFNNGLDSMFKVEMPDFGTDDDDSSNFVPDELSNGDRKPKKRKGLVGRPRKSKGPPQQKTGRKRESKVVHQCDQCDAKYTSLRRLEQHREKHSEGKPPYICEVCGARYKHKRACDIHVALHKGISDWKCEECNKLFPSKGALQRHNNIHTGKLNYQCDLCGKSFIHTSSFKMHKLSHSGVKPHACDVCGLALMTRSHLKRHKRVHSGEKRHECSVCGKRFSERYNLAAHAKSHEAAGGEEPAGEEAAPKPLRRRLFRCTFCQERYERRYMLERHMSSAHGRTLERLPATPRNTMSKLLKAQAQARLPAPQPAPPAAQDALTAVTKEERSPDPRAAPPAPPAPPAHKLQLSSTSTTITAGSWSGAYAAEFGLRHEFPH